MSKIATAVPVEEQRQVTIERREIVAQFDISPLGTESAITKAYTEIGKYMSEHDDVQGYEVTFELWGREFSASVGSDKPRGTRTPQEDWE
jgi:hypothetical protein